MNYFLRGLKNYAVFSGRDTRKEFWYFYLVFIIIEFAADIVLYELKINWNYVRLYDAVMIIPVLTSGARRIHDVNKSGWFVIVPIYSLILLCEHGTYGPNDYGPAPAVYGYGAADYVKPAI